MERVREGERDGGLVVPLFSSTSLTAALGTKVTRLHKHRHCTSTTAQRSLPRRLQGDTRECELWWIFTHSARAV